MGRSSAIRRYPHQADVYYEDSGTSKAPSELRPLGPAQQCWLRSFIVVEESKAGYGAEFLFLQLKMQN